MDIFGNGFIIINVLSADIGCMQGVFTDIGEEGIRYMEPLV